VGYRLDAEGAKSRRPLVERLVPIVGTVERGAEVSVQVPIQWPEHPGLWRVRIDPLLAGALWFEEILGAAALEGQVRVIPAELEGAQPVLRLSDA
jgi:hypothetical protein